MAAYATVEQLAAALRIRVTAENTASLQSKVDAAAVEIDQYIGPNGVAVLPVPAPAPVVEANILRGVELYKSADAAFGVIGFEQIGAVRVSSNPVARFASLLQPYRIEADVVA
jgi:hypothetical protein